MGTLTLYGSDVLDSTLMTASDMAASTGGTETSKQSGGYIGAGAWIEVWSQGNLSQSGASAVGSPSGHGWVYKPGAGTFAAGNWSATGKFDCGSSWNSSLTLQVNFYKYSGGVYTLIGSISTTITAPATGTTATWSATSMPAVTFGANDLLYIDAWSFGFMTGPDGNIASVTVYESTSASQGVTGDMQITTSNFTPVALAGTLYGSDVADATLTTASDMATTTGGTETSKSSGGGSDTAGGWYEVYSQGGNSSAGVAAVGSPSGHGWVYKPGAGTYAAGNWSATAKADIGATASGTANYQMNFYKYSGGVYILIGSISLSSVATGSGKTLTFAATSMSAVTFRLGDLLYTDLWCQGTT